MTKEQFEKLDKCYYPYDMNSRCEEETIDARKLLCGARFDLYAILLYIDHRVKGMEDMTYSTNVYKERTRAITNFKLSEAGNEHKNTFDKFTNVLDKLIEDFQNGNFDINRTLIPVDKNYVLIDGAHRVSCAAYFGKKVRILRFPDEEVANVDHKCLKERILPLHISDAMAMEACRWHTNLFMMFFWPKSFINPDKQTEALQLLYGMPNIDIIYEKECTVTYNAIRNLMIQIYGHMDWVGNIDNDFQATYVKADQVWHNCSKCRLILMRAPTYEYVIGVKAQIRNIFDMGLASVHTTDNINETKLAAKALFNPNSFHFISLGRPTKFKDTYLRIQEFKKAIISSGLNTEDFVIDSGVIMSMYGVRSTRDLDYYVLSGVNTDKIQDIKDIEEHDDKQDLFYKHSISDIIMNPNYHFCFNDMKFVSLEQLLVFKQNRAINDQDIKDIKDIKELLNNMDNKNEIRKAMMRARIKRYKRIIRGFVINNSFRLLKTLHIYTYVRSLYRKVKGKRV